jgi:hypothetical protein
MQMNDVAQAASMDELRLAKVEIRVAQKVLVAINHSACFIVAVSVSLSTFLNK